MDGSTLLLVRGLIGVAIGIAAIAWPGITIALLVGIFGLYAVIDGITNLMLGLSRSQPVNTKNSVCPPIRTFQLVA